MLSTDAIIRHLRLEPHPEGGYYRETYRSGGLIPHAALPPEFSGDRAYATAICFLLEAGGFSAFHRIRSDECWHFYQGVALNIYVLEPTGGLTVIRLGADLPNGDVFQAVVPAGRWFASRPAEPQGYALVGCTVAPGFEFADFEMASAEGLIAEFPQHASLIRQLCRK
jgi:predicted cupin superfamily sugar epimerase